jgi:hypothetical protein
MSTNLSISPSALSTGLTPVQDSSGNSSALRISTQNVSVGSGDALPLFLVVGTPLSNQDDSGCHIMFGDPLAPATGASATLVFAGWNAGHCGFSWSPNAAPGQLAIHIGGSDNPTANPTYFTFSQNGVFAMPALANLPGSGSTADLVINSSGEVSVQTSSARFKEKIEPLDGDFHRVLALSPRRFTYRESGEQAIGYLAEELDELQLRDLVGYDAEGRPLNINYKMIPLYLVELVKEQQRAIEELRDEVRQLRSPSA